MRCGENLEKMKYEPLCDRHSCHDLASSESDTAWQVNDAPYMVAGDVTVRSSDADSPCPVLTVVTVMFFSGTSLSIGYTYYSSAYYGALYARGTESSPITFTSRADTPSPGDWNGIIFNTATDPEQTLFEHCIVEYGNYSNISAYGSPIIRNCVIRHGNAYGIYISTGSLPVVSDNFFTGNGKSAIYSYPNGVENLTGNSGSGNGKDYIEVAGNITSDVTWKKQPLPYGVSGDVTVRYSERDSSTAGLTIEPGVEIRFEPNTGLNVGYYSYGAYYGALWAQGTAESPVIFTSAADAPGPGDWRGINFTDQADDAYSVLEHCVIEYAGNDIHLSNAKPVIQYNTIRNSSNSGIYVYGTGSDDVIISCNNFRDNLYAPVPQQSIWTILHLSPGPRDGSSLLITEPV